ncbi:gliding motility-associated C-terminal domain-containing protein [Pontibacter mangrovi]|uniref:Gliding motility-associated C-terminal domain-containing protein n=1 Tax=Pontibacter mangrovi TaxID=2589816 RepID=A0A501W0T3_9BACT|nr:gliding motility-associated C-terminal domain-containing protein [Pontibacter mangrovi]TPE43249.1 gliding motility-associated C-terminal domain-containing protein [Pontibacter mangrovi]
MITEKVNFSVVNVDPAIQGFHLYTIASPPKQTNGINKPQEVKEYFGLFKVGDPDKKYKVHYKDYALQCGGNLYRRQDNTDSNWEQVADTVSSPLMFYTSSANYGEFAATSQSPEPITVAGPAEICAGSTATLSVSNSGNGQILWSTGETSASITVSEGGSYEVTVTEGNCVRSGFINVQESSPITFSLGEDLKLCSGQTATLSAPSGMASYKWSTGATSQQLTVSEEGTYWVEVSTTAGCTSRDEVNVSVTQEPVLDLPTEVATCYGEEVLLDATTEGATYSWSNGKTTPSVTVTTPGVYTVNIALNNCTFTREVLVSSDECPLIPNIITPNSDGKNDTFVVQGVEKNTLELKIFNRWGKSIYQSDRYDNGWSAAEVPTGVYYYQLTSSRTQKVYKGWLEVIK